MMDHFRIAGIFAAVFTVAAILSIAGRVAVAIAIAIGIVAITVDYAFAVVFAVYSDDV